MNFTISSLLKEALGYRSMRSQRVFQRAYIASLRGMNYDSPHYFENGEIGAMNYVSERLKSLKNIDLVIFDVGANVGDYARDLYLKFGSSAHIFCFEPSSGSFKELQKITKQYSNISAYPFGFGDTEGIFTFFYEKPASTIASLYELPADHPWKGTQTEQVEIKTLSNFCRNENIERISFLKVDVEGHDLQVLLGASEMLKAGKIDFIQFEFGFRQLDSRTFFRDFFKLLNENYKIYRILKDGLFPINDYHEGLEIFVGVSNFLAENRLFATSN